MKINEELKNDKYSKAYSKAKLLAKLKKHAKAAGIKVVYFVLLLFYTLQKSTTPMLAKSVIIGALGYFIIPMDLIPDFIPIVGFSDDLTALVSALTALALYIDEDTKIKAKARLHIWFGDYDKKQLDTLDNKINN